MKPEDFEAIEKAAYERFINSLPESEKTQISPVIAKVASRVAALAIQEYHKRVLLEKTQDQRNS